ncbi:uncharacterized protein LACBIDRAFT_303184 [Laccaria bicolor S238N-H82]|uniref:Predicted protein n=1 Tax=Laccaria bicolor (strain S238N-H82 / ATCC MYA-4686) TaxID=486041 RepID=B0DJ33_LACBS|nr:uncharacterized protein LACBIDRAFT_303184 [Laccaria bicolor S238N-H82]EDR05452.1 predicted protein [Laccaria bicolor S238N-H82]|eukprot:XP_001884010.1 predicted protein [Laccaria bicolor S238N-H82]
MAVGNIGETLPVALYTERSSAATLASHGRKSIRTPMYGSLETPDLFLFSLTTKNLPTTPSVETKV